MKKIDALIVVEGKMDEALLSSFIDADIVTTNGSAISEETLSFIEEASKTRNVILLLDPDSPGKKIRDTIAKKVPSAKHAFVPKEKSIKKHKVGVAECDKETILEALSNLIPEKPGPASNLKMSDLLELGLTGNESSFALRKEAGAKLHIGITNAKTFLKRANALGITKERLEELIDGQN